MSDVDGLGVRVEPAVSQLRVAQRYSVRTPELPMAFTAWEFLRGAAVAWVAFVVISVPHVTITAATSALSQSNFVGNFLVALPASPLMGWWIAIVVIVPWSFGALSTLGIPLAAVLGLLLRQVPNPRIHLLTFATLGAVIGLATTLVFFALSDWTSPTDFRVTVTIVNTILCAACVAAGWWSSASPALAEDARLEAKRVAS